MEPGAGLDERNFRWLRSLGGGTALAAMMNVIAVPGAALAAPWDLVVHEGVSTVISLGGGVAALAGIATFLAAAPLWWIGLDRAGRIRTKPLNPPVRLPMLIAAAMGVLAGIPAVWSLVARLVRWPAGGTNWAPLALGLLLMTSAAANGVALVLWRERIAAYEAARRHTPAAARYRVRLAVAVTFSVAFAMVICWWRLGPWAGPEYEEARAERVMDALAGAQRDVARAGVIDADGDGRGEFAFLPELVGLAPLRGSGTRKRWGKLPTGFERTAEPGVLRRGGYYYVLYLPSADGCATCVQPPGPAARHARSQSRTWAAYAWPVESGVTGRSIYFTDGCDQLYSGATKRRYSGLELVPPAGAAYSPKRDPDRVYFTNGRTPVPENLDADLGSVESALPSTDHIDWHER